MIITKNINFMGVVELLKRLFCRHKWEIVDKEVDIYDYVWGHLNKSGIKRFMNCPKCGSHKEKWLYYTYLRKRSN
jgi:hypothetical protein